jgi:hypothetical protein
VEIFPIDSQYLTKSSWPSVTQQKLSLYVVKYCISNMNKSMKQLLMKLQKRS